MVQDVSLVQRYARTRDAEAFALVVRQYQALVFATCRRRLQNAADVDDAVQETFLRLAQNAGRLNSNVGAWLHRCAMNIATDFNRRRTTRARHESAAAVPVDAASGAQQGLAELRQHVDAALAELPEAQRELIIQRYFVGRAAGEIAQELGIAPSTLTYRLQQAVESLRAQLRQIACAGGAASVVAALEAEQASAVVPAKLSANVMKIGLKGVAPAGTAGAMALVMKVGIAAGVLAAVTAGVWVMGAKGSGQPATPVAATMPARGDGPVTFKAAPAGNDAQATPAAPDWQKTQAAAQSAVLAGRVTDGEGKPVAGAKVRLRGQGSPEATTDAEGRYTFATVPADGEYNFEVRAKGFVSIDPYGRTAQSPVQLSRTAEARRDIALQRGAAFVVTVMDEQGQGIRNVGVDVCPIDDERGSLDRVMTGADGMATIIVPVGRMQYVIAATHDGFAPARAMATPESADTPVDVSIALAKGRELQGVVMCSDGKPAAGWEVYVRPDWWRSSYLPKSYPIGANGQFTIPNVGEGEHQIWLRQNRTSQTIGNVRMPVAQMPIRLDVPFVSAASRAEIKGKVAITGKRPNSVHVTVTGNGDFFTGQVDFGSNANSVDGTYTIPGVPPGVYRIEFEAPELEPKVVNGIKVPGEIPPVQLVASGRPMLLGTVTDAATGKPVTHFAVRVAKVQHLGDGPSYVQEPKWAQVASNEGRFSVELVGPGVYQAQVSADGYAWLWSEKLRVESASAKNELEIKLSAGGALAGLVVDAQGKPLAGAKVIPFSTARSGSQGYRERFQGDAGAAVTDAAGRFVLPHLASGEEKLKVTHPQQAPRIVDGLKVVDGKTSDIGTVALTTGGTVEGTIYDSAGQPAAGVTLQFQDENGYSGGGDEEAGRVAAVTSDEEGRYRVEHLASERLYVNVVDRWKRSGVVRRVVRPVDGKVAKLDFGGTAAVRGRLLGKDGPVAGRRVQLSWGSAHFGSVIVTATTGSDGRFAFLGAPPGKYTLHALADGNRLDFVTVGEVEVTGKAIDLGGMKLGAGSLVVEVDAEDPADADRVAIVAATTDTPGQVWQEHAGQANRDGAAWRIGSLPAGKYRVDAYVMGGGEWTARTRVDRNADGSPATVKLRIPKATAKLDATIIAPSGDEGNPMSQVVVLSNADQTISASLRANQKGGLSLPPGEYRVLDMATATPRADVPSIVLQAGETKQVTINAVAAGGPKLVLVLVQVWSAEGLPVDGARVRLVGRDGAVFEMKREMEGTTLFSVAPGKYTAEVDAPGGGTVKQEVEAIVAKLGRLGTEVNVVLP